MSKSTQALAAAEIRKKLKAAGIKAKVTSTSASMMTAVRVKVADESPDMMETIRATVAPYQYGKFNPMEDLYEYSNSNDELPQVKYITITNDISDEFNQKVWSWLRERYVNAAELPAAYEEARYMTFAMGEVCQVVYRHICQKALFSKMAQA